MTATLIEIRDLLSQSKQPIFYISRTATHLLGVERTVPGLFSITLVDSWDGEHPSVFTPSRIPAAAPRGNIKVVNWLLKNREVREHIVANTPAGFTPKVILAFFDEQSERLCEQLGFELIMPTTELRNRVDSKMETTRLGNSVGVSSVPNAITVVENWDDLVRCAEEAGLGHNWVIQTAFGNSGETTYFVSSQADFDRVSEKIIGIEIKVMKYINHLPVAVDAMVTKSGTVVGPLLSEVTGHKQLTQYAGGWSGNEMSPDLMSPAIRRVGVDMVRRFGDRLAQEGYRGTLGVDLLIDTDTDEVYLGEINPRLTGSISVSNLETGPFLKLPLFALHVLEYSNIDARVDTDLINEGSATAQDAEWSHMVIRAVDRAPSKLLSVPKTGIYQFGDEGKLSFLRSALDWHTLVQKDEVFILNTVKTGNNSTRGTDLGIVYLRGRVQDSERQLTPNALQLIESVRSLYLTSRLSPLQNFVRKAKLAIALVLKR